jgi:hypothetical protein
MEMGPYIMEVKLFEIRDEATFIPALAIRIDPRCEEEQYLLARSGYGLDRAAQDGYILLMRLSGTTNEITCDPHVWHCGRTMAKAHHHIIEYWDSLVSGSVICVESILGERTTPVVSERGSISIAPKTC